MEHQERHPRSLYQRKRAGAATSATTPCQASSRPTGPPSGSRYPGISPRRSGGARCAPPPSSRTRNVCGHTHAEEIFREARRFDEVMSVPERSAARPRAAPTISKAIFVPSGDNAALPAHALDDGISRRGRTWPVSGSERPGRHPRTRDPTCELRGPNGGL